MFSEDAEILLASRKNLYQMDIAAPEEYNWRSFSRLEQMLPSMKLGLPFIPVKTVIVLAAIAYLGGYVFFSERTIERRSIGRGEICHFRTFRHDWQVQLFRPAASLEFQLIRFVPQPFVAKPADAELPQALQLRGPGISRYHAAQR